jgi:perosamine synthetase
MKVPIARASLTSEAIDSVLEPLRSGWLVQGPKVRAFEEAWCSFTGAEHSIAVTSCTAALHLSLAALGFGPGDEPIVPAFTWIATANVVEHLGGRVVFADIDLATFNINPRGIEALITPRTKAILPLHSAMGFGWWRMPPVVLVPLIKAGTLAPLGTRAASAFIPAKQSPPAKGA